MCYGLVVERSRLETRQSKQLALARKLPKATGSGLILQGKTTSTLYIRNTAVRGHCEWSLQSRKYLETEWGDCEEAEEGT